MPSPEQRPRFTIGQTVFVVNRFASGADGTHTATVTAVGRKYGWVGQQNQFDLQTGHSAHHTGPDENARVNGRGFDVYVSEEAYLAKVEQFLSTGTRI